MNSMNSSKSSMTSMSSHKRDKPPSSLTSYMAKFPPKYSTAAGPNQSDTMVSFMGGKWRELPAENPEGQTTYFDIKFFYANLIDYGRIALSMLGCLCMFSDWHLLTFVLCSSSFLLDYVDGIVARKYNQCSVFGSGIDWVADIISELIGGIWMLRYDNSMFLTVWFFAMISIEVFFGFFDYGVTTTLKYPSTAAKHTGFFKIIDILTPEGTYNRLGNWAFLSFNFFCLFVALEGAYGFEAGTHSIMGLFFLFNRTVIIFLASLYGWMELATGFRMLSWWREPARTYKPDLVRKETSRYGGFELYKPLSEDLQTLLNTLLVHVKDNLGMELQTSLDKKAIFWANLFQRTTSGDVFLLPSQHFTTFMAGLPDILNKYFDFPVVPDGIGFIINPVGSSTQPWHLDYCYDYATLFIPISGLSDHNATQLAIPDPTLTTDEVYEAATADPDHVDLNKFIEAGSNYTLRQVVAPSFSVFKMDFGSIHRGVTNTGNDHRVLFYISVKRDGAEFIEREKDFEDIENKKCEHIPKPSSTPAKGHANGYESTDSGVN